MNRRRDMHPADSPSPGSDGASPPVEVSQGSFRVDLGFVAVYLIRDSDGWTAIDSGVSGSAKPISAALERLEPGMPLHRVVVTHCHADHAGGLAGLRDGPLPRVVAHRLDAPFIRGQLPIPEAILTEEEQPLYDAIAPWSFPVTVRPSLARPRKTPCCERPRA